MENQVIEELKQGKVVTVPTETVFGYAVSLNSETGIKELMRMKERGFDSGKVFTLVPANIEDMTQYVSLNQKAKSLIEQYMPGEITVILPKNPNFHHFYYDHYDTIGIRIPDHPLFQKILPEIGPLLLTSANPRGGTPKSETGHKPSTIIDCTTDMPKILRQGDLIVKL